MPVRDARRVRRGDVGHDARSAPCAKDAPDLRVGLRRAHRAADRRREAARPRPRADREVPGRALAEQVGPGAEGDHPARRDPAKRPRSDADRVEPRTARTQGARPAPRGSPAARALDHRGDPPGRRAARATRDRDARLRRPTAAGGCGRCTGGTCGTRRSSSTPKTAARTQPGRCGCSRRSRPTSRQWRLASGRPSEARRSSRAWTASRRPRGAYNNGGSRTFARRAQDSRRLPPAPI